MITNNPLPKSSCLNDTTNISWINGARGYVILSSVIFMTMLILLSVSIVNLSSVTQRTTSETRHQSIAESNARMALCIAIAELQKHTGNDQIITTRADILDTQTDLSKPAAKEKTIHGRYTLAFQTQPIDGDYNHEDYGNGIFLRTSPGLPAVLVSGNEKFDISDVSLSAYPKGYTTQDSQTDQNFVTVHRGGSLASNSVKVPKVAILDDYNAGNYAYWISGENVKARVNISDSHEMKNESLGNATSTEYGKFYSLETPPSPGISWAGNEDLNSSGLLQNIATHNSGRHSFHSYDTLLLANTDADKSAYRNHFHDFTTVSNTVLSNPKHGGLKKNLTAAVNLTDLEFLSLIKHIKNEKAHDDPVFLFKNYTFPNQKPKITYLNYPGAVWELFRSYIRRPEFEPVLEGKSPELLAHLGGKAHKISHYWEMNKKQSDALRCRLVRRTPILQRFQVAIDYSLGYEGIVEDDDAKWHEFSMRQHFIPLVSYWNPYNVSLTTAEKHVYKVYNDRSYGTHQHHSTFNASFVDAIEWKVLAMAQLDSRIAWSEIHTNSANFYYPFHPTGGVKDDRFSKTNYGLQIRPFTIAAGETASFALLGENRLLDYKSKNYLERITDIKDSTGYSFYTKTAKFRVKITGSLSAADATPELTLVRYPSSGGDNLTRVHVSNSTTFQQANLNFGSVTSRSDIAFTPTIIKDNQRLPSSDSNGTESPKFAGMIVRKQVDFSHYYPNDTSWQNLSSGLDTNTYNAPFNVLYNPVAARQSAYGQTIGASNFTFSSPVMYLAGVVVGQSDFDLVSPEISAEGDCYVGYSDRASGGSTKSIQYSIPRAENRLSNIAQLSQINLSKWLSNYNISQDFASVTDSITQNNSIGNSFASPHIAPNRTFVDAYDSSSYKGQSDATYSSTQIDSSFHYNEALWDRYFMTGERAGEITSLTKLRNLLPNQNLIADPDASLEKHLDPHESSSQLMLKGGFNVNSTSVEAWKAMLSATIGKSTSEGDSADNNLVPFPNISYIAAQPLSSPPTEITDKSLYDGSTYRALNQDEITLLAKNIVAQNKLRGPYFSLSQFINRSLSPALHYRHYRLKQPITNSEVCYEGAIQSAINHSGINGVFDSHEIQYPNELSVGDELVSVNDDSAEFTDYEKGKINPKALKYHPGFGYTSTLTQADILSRIGHLLTVRSDTFKIISYGDSLDKSGKIIASAYCEAIVQRSTDWINPADKDSSISPYKWKLEKHNSGQWRPNLSLSPLSRKFGRRYCLVSFKWLNKEDI